MPASTHGGKIASCEDETRAKTMSTTTAIAIGQGDSPLMTWPVSGSTDPSPSSSSGVVSSALTMAEGVGLDVAHRRVADGLVDVVRRRVGQVGEQEAEPATGVERLLADRRDEGARVPAAASVRGRVDRADPDAIGRPPAGPRERDDVAVLPQMEAPATSRQPSVGVGDDRYGIGVAKRVEPERLEPGDDEVAIVERRRPGVAGDGWDRLDLGQLIDPLRHLEGARRAAKRRSRLDEGTDVLDRAEHVGQLVRRPIRGEEPDGPRVVDFGQDESERWRPDRRGHDPAMVASRPRGRAARCRPRAPR